MVDRKTLLDADNRLLITSDYTEQWSSDKDMGRQGDKQGHVSGPFSGWLVSESWVTTIYCLTRRWRPVVALLRFGGGASRSGWLTHIHFR